MRINGIDLKPFAPWEREVLRLLGLAQPGCVSMKDLVELLYPNPFDTTDDPEGAIATGIHRLRKRGHLMNGWKVAVGYGWRGYRLVRIEKG